MSNWHLKQHILNQTLHLLLKPAPPTYFPASGDSKPFFSVFWPQTLESSLFSFSLILFIWSIIQSCCFYLQIYPDTAFSAPSTTLTGTTIVSHLDYCDCLQYSSLLWSTVNRAVGHIMSCLATNHPRALWKQVGVLTASYKAQKGLPWCSLTYSPIAPLLPSL